MSTDDPPVPPDPSPSVAWAAPPSAVPLLPPVAATLAPVSPPLLPLLPLVAAGGALGSLARYAFTEALPHRPPELPTATLLVNVIGCALLGLLVGALPRRPWLRAFAGTGVLGGFTTFSAFALETDRLLRRAPAVALMYVALSVAIGLGVAAAGVALGTRLRG